MSTSLVTNQSIRLARYLVRVRGFAIREGREKLTGMKIPTIYSAAMTTHERAGEAERSSAHEGASRGEATEVHGGAGCRGGRERRGRYMARERVRGV
jgi:hypothetical protein